MFKSLNEHFGVR